MYTQAEDKMKHYFWLKKQKKVDVWVPLSNNNYI